MTRKKSLKQEKSEVTEKEKSKLKRGVKDHDVDQAECVQPPKKVKKKVDNKKEMQGLEQQADKRPPKRPKDKNKKKKSKEDKSKHESVGQNKALRYLDAWNDDRGNWKFEKCRQIWLLQHWRDDTRIPDEKFDTLLKYIGSVQGRMREGTLEDARKTLTLEDEWKKLSEEGKKEEEIETQLRKPRPATSELSRASDIVEMLAT